jgi:hypothetical protein
MASRVTSERICPVPNGVYEWLFFGNGNINLDNMRSAVSLLLTDPPGPDLENVFAAVKRAWLIHRHALRWHRVSELVQHASDLELTTFVGLCRVQAQINPGMTSLSKLVAATNALCCAVVIDPQRVPWAGELHAALTRISDMWFSIGPGPRIFQYAEAAALALEACAAVIESPPPAGAVPYPVWCEGTTTQLSVVAYEEMDALVWGITRSAHFLLGQVNLPECRKFALPDALRVRVVDVIAAKLAPSLDATQLAESVYNLYRSGSSQPGDCALYSRQTTHKACSVTEALQQTRQRIYKEAFSLLHVDAASAIRDVGWPEGTRKDLGRRLSQFMREIVLTRTMGMYCTVPGGTSNRIKSYTELEHSETGWWNPPDIAYPCIVRAGSFWILIDAGRRSLMFALDVVDAVSWLLAAISDVDHSTDSFIQRLQLDKDP